MPDKKEAAIEAVRLKTVALREFMTKHGLSPDDLKSYASMLIVEAEVVRLQWMKDKN